MRCFLLFCFGEDEASIQCFILNVRKRTKRRGTAFDALLTFLIEVRNLILKRVKEMGSAL